MERRVVFTKSVGDVRLKDIIDRPMNMNTPEEFLAKMMKLAKNAGWNLESVDLMFVRENKDGDWQDDTLFINVYQQ